MKYIYIYEFYHRKPKYYGVWEKLATLTPERCNASLKSAYAYNNHLCSSPWSNTWTKSLDEVRY